MKTNGFVLAGGKSTRMGRDKALLYWNGRTLLEHMQNLLAGATDHVRVVGRKDLPDRLPGCGPLGGILTSLEVSETNANLVVAVDLPFLTVPFLSYFRTRLDSSNCIALACNIESQFPLCLGFRREVIPIVAERIRAGELSIHGLIAACGADIASAVELERAGFGLSLFRNINTEADYLRLCTPKACEQP